MKKLFLRFFTCCTRMIIMICLTGLLIPPRPVLSQASKDFQQDWFTKAGNFERHGSAPQELPLHNGTLNLRWKKFLGERIEVEMQPVIVGNLLYIGLMNGKMFALDKSTGETQWVYKTGWGITDPPTVFSVQNESRIFFGSTNGTLYCLNAITGEEIWHYETGGPIMSTPTILADTLFIGSLDGHFYALDTRSGELRWKFLTTGPISTTSASNSASSLVYVATGDNHAYAFNQAGEVVWERQMHGAYTKRNYIVHANGVVIFSTRKPGAEYSEPLENLPEILQDTIQPAEIVLKAWSDYYTQFPNRRSLYFFNAQTGDDLWNPQNDPTLFTPLYIPYWGEIMPVIDSKGNAYFPATGGGGDHALVHDVRLWKMELQTGRYTQIALQNEFSPRYDEVGRPTLIGQRYFQTMSEDIGYYNVETKRLNANVYGNTFTVSSAPLEFSEMRTNVVFGGLQKHFLRFSSSTPVAFAGAADAASPVVVAGNDAYYTAWGHVYALTSESVVPVKDYGNFDPMQVLKPDLTRNDFTAELNERISEIIKSNVHIDPASRFWSWNTIFGTFWHNGEVVTTLSETLPFLSQTNATKLKSYLQIEVTGYLLNPHFYEYRWACLDYDTQSLIDPCERGGIQAGWFWSNPNLTAERIYALYKYAEKTGDWETILQNYQFIAGLFQGFEPFWDEETGYFLFPEWHAGTFNSNLQIGATFAMREIARQANDVITQQTADAFLSKMLDKKIYWGKYVRSLYDTGELRRQDLDNWEEWGYLLDVEPIPVEGYYDKDNDYRQVYFIQREDGVLNIQYESPRYLLQPYQLIGFHPFYSEINEYIQQVLYDELHDYVAAIEYTSPTWYMSDYSHSSGISGYEDESFSPVAASDIFQAKAYILNYNFEELAPFLPWTFEDYGSFDLFRIQNLVALLKASIPADLNRDGQVNSLDSENWIALVQQSQISEDVNEDGVLNIKDFIVWYKSWSQTP